MSLPRGGGRGGGGLIPKIVNQARLAAEVDSQGSDQLQMIRPGRTQDPARPPAPAPDPAQGLDISVVSEALSNASKSAPSPGYVEYVGDVVGKGAGAVRSATARYPTVMVFGFIFVSLVIIKPPYVCDEKGRTLSLRSATAASVLFTGVFKFTLNYLVL